MKEIIMKKTGGSGNLPDEIKAYALEWSDAEEGVSKEDFHSILDKASQPIKGKEKEGSK